MNKLLTIIKKYPAPRLVLVSVCLYAISLALPGITYLGPVMDNNYSNLYYSHPDQSFKIVEDLVNDGAICYAGMGTVRLSKPKGIEYLTDHSYVRGDPRVEAWKCFTSDSSQTVSENGLTILALGWLGAFDGNFAWYANLFLILSILLALRKRQGKYCMIPPIIALLLALDAYRFQRRPLDEGGVEYEIVHHLAIGYYCWFLSILLIAATIFAHRPSQRASEDAQEFLTKGQS